MGKLIDLTGCVFGRLTVLSRAQNITPGNSRWLCLCSCGNKTTVQTNSLKRGTKSCGCFRKEVMTKHNRRSSRAYSSWRSMLTRCNNPSAPAYKNYGGRGIKVCERWHSFENFFKDMGEPCKGMSLDRINNDGDYTLSNCRWATVAEQGRNRRTNRIITYGGESMCLKDWAKRLNISGGALSSRLKHWPLNVALTTPNTRIKS